MTYKQATARPEKTVIGAIRWDAWTAHDGVFDSVISQVERSLSPKQYHFRAPFFADVSEDGGIIIPEYTMEIFDREMEYAKEAGIGYFAYVWYNSIMKTARRFHTKSRYKTDVKMCTCLDGNAIGKEFAHRDMETLLAEDYYMTVLGGRPLMYYIAYPKTLDMIGEDIRYYRELTHKLGVPDPYAVIMNGTVETADRLNADAISAYAIPGADNAPFNTVMSNAYAKWSEWNDSGAQYVPVVSLGWNPEPRYINPVSWTSITNNAWAQLPSIGDIEEHLIDALSYMELGAVAEKTETNTLLLYAWNEHDEGGWLCPTIAVDENGNAIYSSDGVKEINTERVAAVRMAFEQFDLGKRSEREFNF